VSARNVLDNLDAMVKHYRGLRYVQIDDGYQPAMGDWLETGAAFGGDLKGVLGEIRKRGLEPAIWVAPFIAERGSHLFQQHPEWMVRDGNGEPLSSDKVTFGGWRRGPWFALDGTNGEVQRHLETLFRTMRQEWGCTYFKLDANFWGAMHGGRFADPKATRIEAYRLGMQAILRGAGDSFILGCNHPLWPSFGLIHGSRSSSDISRRWTTIRKTARENLSRNWQNRKLWWNDPDAVVLSGELPLNEFQFHATAVYAAGGMILSGDDLTRLPADRAAMLRKLLPPTGVAARFDDSTLETGVIDLGAKTMICAFNWGEEPRTVVARLPRAARVRDFWSGADRGRHTAALTLEKLGARSAALLECW
jgi:alpha-galactosidase